MDDYGKLIVSTKAMAAGRKIYIYVVSAFLILLGFVCLLFCGPIFEEIAGDLFRKPSMGVVLQFGLAAIVIGFGAFMLISSFLGFKSYCDVYERGVKGVTGMSANKNAAPQQNLQIPYRDILNVTESGKTIFLYTNHGNFEFLALKNRTEVAQEIRRRIAGQERR